MSFPRWHFAGYSHITVFIQWGPQLPLELTTISDIPPGYISQCLLFVALYLWVVSPKPFGTHTRTHRQTYTHTYTFWPCNLRHEKSNNPPRPRSFQFPWATKNTRFYHLIVLLGWKRFPYYGSVCNSPFHQQSTIIYHVDLHNFHC